MVVLNLFYLPVVLAGFCLGRYRAGVLALFSVVGVLVVATLDLGAFNSPGSPLAIGLSLLVWAAVLGLTTLLVGTLSDERSAKLVELHEAYVGVVEVLSRYLQSANPQLKARSQRIAELCQRVATEMRLSPRETTAKANWRPSGDQPPAESMKRRESMWGSLASLARRRSTSPLSASAR